MCGIAGIVRWDGPPIEADVVDRMIRLLAHRGPDDSGRFLSDNVALGHRRLAVIDPGHGQQPIFSEDKSVAVSFNGTIYNYRELQKELKQAGHRFRTQCDSEVVVHAWEQWGPDCVRRFRGMFAFGLVDWNRREVFLARDRFGIKPLVYSLGKRSLVFASTITSLRAAPDQPAEIDLAGVGEYLESGYICAPKTIFRGILKLPEAHCLTVRFDGDTEGPQRYWSLEPTVGGSRHWDDWVAELEATLRESVEHHLVADVPVGAFLSGGVDSSLLVSLMAGCVRGPLKTYSVGFHDDPSSELGFASAVANRWQTDHSELIVNWDMVRDLPELLGQMGEPMADWAALPLARLAARAKQEVVVCLSGDGGDELFAGYDSYVKWMRRMKALDSSRVEAWLECRTRIQTPGAARALCRPEFRDRMNGSQDVIRQSLEESAGFPMLEQALHVDRRTYLSSGLLNKADAASMMHGLEVRTPFLDHRVAELACRIPSELKLGQALDGAPMSKLILRKVLSQYFPSEFVERPKQGFTPPLSQWLRSRPALGDEMARQLTREGARLHEYLEPAALRRFVAEIPSMQWLEPFWALYALEIWMETCCSGSISA